MEPTFSFKTKLWRWSGEAAWHFLTVNHSISKKIKDLQEGPRRGFGSIKVIVKIGKTTFKTSIFPTKEKTYLLPVKQAVRKAEQLKENMLVQVNITLI